MLKDDEAAWLIQLTKGGRWWVDRDIDRPKVIDPVETLIEQGLVDLVWSRESNWSSGAPYPYHWGAEATEKGRMVCKFLLSSGFVTDHPTKTMKKYD